MTQGVTPHLCKQTTLMPSTPTRKSKDILTPTRKLKPNLMDLKTLDVDINWRELVETYYPEFPPLPTNSKAELYTLVYNAVSFFFEYYCPDRILLNPGSSKRVKGRVASLTVPAHLAHCFVEWFKEADEAGFEDLDEIDSQKIFDAVDAAHRDRRLQEAADAASHRDRQVQQTSTSGAGVNNGQGVKITPSKSLTLKPVPITSLHHADANNNETDNDSSSVDLTDDSNSDSEPIEIHVIEPIETSASRAKPSKDSQLKRQGQVKPGTSKISRKKVDGHVEMAAAGTSALNRQPPISEEMLQNLLFPSTTAPMQKIPSLPSFKKRSSAVAEPPRKKVKPDLPFELAYEHVLNQAALTTKQPARQQSSYNTVMQQPAKQQSSYTVMQQPARQQSSYTVMQQPSYTSTQQPSFIPPKQSSPKKLRVIPPKQSSPPKKLKSILKNSKPLADASLFKGDTILSREQQVFDAYSGSHSYTTAASRKDNVASLNDRFKSPFQVQAFPDHTPMSPVQDLESDSWDWNDD